MDTAPASRPARAPSRPRAVVALLGSLALAATGCAHRPPSDAGTANTSANATRASAVAVRYLALGDSFTIGTGSSPEASFPARLSARLRADGRDVVVLNLGLNGYTTQTLIDRELPEVPSFAPTLVTLAIGANDIVRGGDEATYRAQLRRIFAALADAGVPGAHIVSVPQPEWSRSPVAAAFGEPAEISARIAAFNTALAAESARVGARYVDLWPLMHAQAAAGMLADDELHPSAAAHDAWAAALYDAGVGARP